MFKIAAMLALAVSLAACDMASTLIDGWRYAKAVEADLEASTGIKPQVGFNWRNGRLVRVTVAFPRLYDAKPLRDMAEIVRRSVTSHFKQTPEDIQLAFSLGKADAGTTAQPSATSKKAKGSAPHARTSSAAATECRRNCSAAAC